jgi:hypothetical protein
MNRRNFLKLMAVCGVTASCGYILSEVAPWLDYETEADNLWQHTESGSTTASTLRTLVYYATLAANGHNTQPWKFAIRKNSIEIHPDYSRSLSVVDPQNRALWISLGCALENLIIASRALGFTYQVDYPEDTDHIHVYLEEDIPVDSAYFQAIPFRQNTRSEYDGRLIKNDDYKMLHALPLEPGVILRFLDTPSDMEIAQEYIYQGNLAQYGDQAFVNELITWLRFNKKEALDKMDGLYSGCSGNPEVPRWLGQMFVSRTKPHQQAEADRKKLLTSPSAVVIASETEDKTSWVRTGQVYERLALQMTVMGIQSAFLNQPIETDSMRSQFQSALNLGIQLPQLFVRFGYGDVLSKSLRRPIEEVLI